MIEEYAIQRVLNLYSEGATRGDWDQMIATFLPEGVWEIPALGLKLEGREGIRQGMMAVAAPMTFVVQLNTPALIDIDGDRATARSVIRECAKYKDRDEALEVLGIYADKLVKTAGGWKFARRTFELNGMHSYKVSQPALG
jgi:hypothetical protein